MLQDLTLTTYGFRVKAANALYSQIENGFKAEVLEAKRFWKQSMFSTWRILKALDVVVIPSGKCTVSFI